MTRPIADHALLGDCHSAALVSRDGCVVWWCPARFDARSVFARLLDPGAGHFSIAPVGPCEAQRAYADGTMVLITTFRTPTGTLRLTDALAFAPGARGHDIGLRSPHVLVRLVEVLDGQVEVAVEYAPRLEYGLIAPRLDQTEEGVLSVGGPDTLLLVTSVDLELADGTASGRATLTAGARATFAVHHRDGMAKSGFERLDVAATIADTTAGWRSWIAEHERYDGAYAEAVERSALVLQALTYAPSGTIVAAPTTSLPEILGGEANWDYRYAWLRDASLTLEALWVAACPHEADRYFAWMAAAIGDPDDGPIPVVFGVEGERDLSERELGHLAGYGGSRPVRVGNAAWGQRQLDVMGEILHAAHLLRDRIAFDPPTARFLCGLADQAAAGWREPDAGIWESREGERHYTSSKLMCWVALDRAIELAPQLGDGAHPEAWGRERDAVRDEILRRAYHADSGVYAGALDSDHLDASVLLMPIMGLVEAGEERMRATIDAIDHELGVDGLVRRWTGATEDEGAFVICSFWLADCLARAGDLDRAREVFEHVLAHANDVGLLAEEIDPRDGRLLGNFPQAFSHVGLINAAWSIDQAARA